MKEYCIVESGDTNQLTAEVETLLSQGWHPAGGISMVATIDRDGWRVVYYAQAMIKHSPKPQHATVSLEE
jgi:hypothetical protein